MAADVESQPHKSKLNESGINTLSTNTYLIGQFTQTINGPRTSKRLLTAMGFL
jgi:hypothetical protein